MTAITIDLEGISLKNMLALVGLLTEVGVLEEQCHSYGTCGHRLRDHRIDSEYHKEYPWPRYGLRTRCSGDKVYGDDDKYGCQCETLRLVNSQGIPLDIGLLIGDIQTWLDR